MVGEIIEIIEIVEMRLPEIIWSFMEVARSFIGDLLVRKNFFLKKTYFFKVSN